MKTFDVWLSVWLLCDTLSQSLSCAWSHQMKATQTHWAGKSSRPKGSCSWALLEIEEITSNAMRNHGSCDICVQDRVIDCVFITGTSVVALHPSGEWTVRGRNGDSDLHVMKGSPVGAEANSPWGQLRPWDILLSTHTHTHTAGPCWSVLKCHPGCYAFKSPSPHSAAGQSQDFKAGLPLLLPMPTRPPHPNPPGKHRDGDRETKKERRRDGDGDRELTLLAPRDEADCFEAIYQPTLTFPCAWPRSSLWVSRAGDENKSKHEHREEGKGNDWRGRRGEAQHCLIVGGTRRRVMPWEVVPNFFGHKENICHISHNIWHH